MNSIADMGDKKKNLQKRLKRNKVTMGFVQLWLKPDHDKPTLFDSASFPDGHDSWPALKLTNACDSLF